MSTASSPSPSAVSTAALDRGAVDSPGGAKIRPYYAFCRFLCQTAFLTFFRGRAFHTQRVPRSGGVLLVCNHQSYLDPVLATLALPRECHYMARDTLFKAGIFKKLIESLNAFPVKRATADVGAIKETLRRLKAGALITVFPEATRTHDGRVRPMQAGPVLIARKAGVPLIPTMILGAYEAWPRNAKGPHPAPVIVAYGEPVLPEQAREMPEGDCIALLRSRIIEMMRHYAMHPLVAGRLATADFDGKADSQGEAADG